MKQLASLRQEVEDWQRLSQSVADALELSRLEDESLRSELERETDQAEQEIERRELEVMLSGKYDHGDALLAIHAGAGGTDSQDWADMLERMYLRWCELRHFTTEILDVTPGEEAGIKSVTIAVDGPFAYRLSAPRKRGPPAGTALTIRCCPPPPYLIRPGRGAAAGRGR